MEGSHMRIKDGRSAWKYAVGSWKEDSLICKGNHLNGAFKVLLHLIAALMLMMMGYSKSKDGVSPKMVDLKSLDLPPCGLTR